MTTTKHTVTIGGVVHTRTSKTRVYTHVVIGRRAEADARAVAAEYTKLDRQNFRFFVERLDAAEAGDLSAFKYMQRTPAEVAALVEGGEDAYRARIIAQRLRQCDEAAAKGAYNIKPLGWCGSEALAQRAARGEFSRRGYYSDVRVVPVGAVID